MQKGGYMINKGSSACIFKPYIPCNNETRKTKRKKRISKIFVGNNSRKKASREYKLNQKLKKKKSYKDWAVLWDTKCIPISYDKIYSRDKDIEYCLSTKRQQKNNFNNHRIMLLGTESGISFYQYMKQQLPPSLFTHPSLFQTKLVQIIHTMRPLFIGLQELFDLKICHLDISPWNTIYSKNSLKYIDFGESCLFHETNIFRQRSLTLVNSDHIYIPNPLEFIYYYASSKTLQEEYHDSKKHIYRAHYKIYKRIHTLFFKRKKTLHQHIKDILSNTYNRVPESEIIRSIDTYSLGMLLPFTISILCQEYKLPVSTLQTCLAYRNKELYEYISLFHTMTELECKNRLSPKEVIRIYTTIYNKYHA